MRDPQGSIQFESDRILRRLHAPLAREHFLHREEALRLISDRRMVGYSFLDELSIASPKIPFVSYPYEWTDAHFSDAASLTLDISEAALPTGWELKDASAWNIIFDGTEPTFCDHLSFQPATDARWWAFAQFIRHFIFPLCLSKYRGLRAGAAFKLSRDGLSPCQVRDMLGLKRFLTRYWPLMLKPGAPPSVKAVDTGKKHHGNLYAVTRWFLKGLTANPSKVSHWASYTVSRDHYSDAASTAKYATIQVWLQRLHPAWVIDFGCNTGEYSMLASNHGANVVAVDLDHDCVQNIYLSQRGNRHIFPVVANLDDISGGNGWGGKEFPGLLQRLEAVGEMTFMLALIHHLAISASIPYERIAQLARKVSRKWLIVELLEESDPLVQLLCIQRKREPAEFSLARQQAAFLKDFNILDQYRIPDTGRHLLLLEAR